MTAAFLCHFIFNEHRFRVILRCFDQPHGIFQVCAYADYTVATQQRYRFSIQSFLDTLVDSVGTMIAVRQALYGAEDLMQEGIFSGFKIPISKGIGR